MLGAASYWNVDESMTKGQRLESVCDAVKYGAVSSYEEAVKWYVTNVEDL